MSKQISGWQPRVSSDSRQRQWVENAIQKGHSPAQIMTALEMVPLACEFSGYHNQLIAGQLYFTPSSPWISHWQRYWFSPQCLWKTLIDGMFPSEEGNPRWSVLLRAGRIFGKRWDRWSPDQRRAYLLEDGEEAFLQAVREGREIALETLEETLWKACHHDKSECIVSLSDEAATAVRFLLQVALPAYMQFGFSHQKLYQQAAFEGDGQALARILKLDSSARMLPEIAEVLNTLCHKHDSRQLELIRDEENAPYHYLGSSTAVACKAAFTGLLIDAFGILKGNPKLGKPFKIPQIARLFDARAWDISRRPCDEDIQVSEEAFRKMVNRSRKRLGWAFRDIFSAEHVPVT